MSSEGTYIKLRNPFLYFDTVDIENVSEAESTENQKSKWIKELQGDFLSLAMATPKDITPKGEDPINYVKERVENLFSDFYDAYHELFDVQLINQILEEWKYSYSSDPKEIYENCQSDNEVNKNAFPEDRHEEIKRDLNKFTFAPPDDSIGDALERSERNFNLYRDLSEFISDKYVIITHGKVYVDYDGQFLFKTEEAAKEVLKKRFDFHTSDYISKEFIENHPNFFDSVIRLMEYFSYEKEYIDKFTEAVNRFKEGDNKFDMDLMNTIYEGLDNVSYERLCNTCGICICKLSNLTK